MRVHNHNPEEGVGLACQERLIGDCIRAELLAALEDAADFLKPRNAKADLARGSDASHVHKRLVAVALKLR